MQTYWVKLPWFSESTVIIISWMWNEDYNKNRHFVPILTKKKTMVTQVNWSIVPLQGLPVLAPEPLSKEHWNLLGYIVMKVSCSMFSGSKDTVICYTSSSAEKMLWTHMSNPNNESGFILFFTLPSLFQLA